MTGQTHLHLERIGVKLTKLTKKQADYLVRARVQRVEHQHDYGAVGCGSQVMGNL